MDSAVRQGQHSVKDLEKKINESLLSALHTLHTAQLDISLYLLHHNTQDIRRDPLSGNGLDEVYSMYEERANECRRLWMKVRALSEKRISTTGPAESFPSGSRLDLQTSVSPLEYQSTPDEDELGGARRNDRVAIMDVDPADVEQDNPRLSTSPADPHPPVPKNKVCPCLFQTKLC